MTIEIKVPTLPESVADATLVAWHKKVGEAVSRDENLVDLETDKVVLEVPAPTSGTIIEIVAANGATVVAGDVLALLEEGDAPAATQEPVKRVIEAPAAEASESVVAKLSPAVRRLLEEHDLDATIVMGSGKDSRITKSDVMGYLKNHSDENVAPGDPAPELEIGMVTAGPSRTEQRVPMTRLRARIAERMVEAQQTAAMLTTFNEVDLTKVISLRKRHKEAFEKEHGVRLGFMSFFAKAAVEGLKKFPAVNASVEDSDIVYHDYVDIGIAVSSERGLMVPVLRDVDHSSFAKIEADINMYAGKARDGSMSMEDLTGGTFTITNGGIFGSMLSTPILNPPQSAILGMHNIQERPVAIDGEVVIRPMMYLALTYDHRIIDGKEAVQFLISIKNSLEDPGRLLLQV
ncbi:MAG: 2-oxoglutarate dehydrogenase complex dihydrolipoyllysine-residue succinyltransferase [Woeseia sp.]|jgi:2-oxoglutarate dehydrogenase E2 component (dihydrolipoamide succinyltransferase)|nr:2-oxoglutarate dehydrogenase complex dihydrolipoyllysine-residue succinyltransferase [Woeseia sp.]